MRLTCPNCGAQYEVPDDVIPSEGRDVQCSDCGTTWFQAGAMSEGVPSEPAPEAPVEPEVNETPQEDFTTAADVVEDAPDEEALHVQDTPDVDEASEDLAADPEEFDHVEDEEFDDDEASSEDVAPDRLQRGLNSSVAGILREEAEREAALRAAETVGLETQPDLGLEAPSADDTEQRAQETRERMARLRGEPTEAPEEDFSGSRRGLLPDIEEINSSLRGGGETAAAAATMTSRDRPQRRRSGFLRGFTIAILLAVGAALVYKNSDAITAQVPQASPVLESYVDWVNETRIWLHTQVEQLAQQSNASQ